MKTHLSCLVAVIVCGAGVTACGSSGSGKDNGGTPGDAGATDVQVQDVIVVVDSGAPDAAGDAAPVDHGAPSSTYPAFTPDVGQIAYNGGLVMQHPVIVAITWNTDASQATFDGYADAIGGTGYWSAATKEYGVGAATSGTANHVHLSTTPPASLQDSDLQTMVTTYAGATGGWPAPTQDTIYAFFLPPKLSLQVQNFMGSGLQDACSAGEGGYHDQVTVGTVTTSYAVVPSCTFGPGNTAEQQTTMSMSHELIEASTDPQPQQTMNGYTGFDSDHFAWDYFQQLQSEVGDACEFFKESFFEDQETAPAPFDAWVQRTWSNAAITAAHDPCVPAAPGPYFSVTPLSLDMVTYTIPTVLTGQPTATIVNTKGLLAPTGQSVTFPIGFYSDGPTSGPWTISVAAGNPLLGAQSLIDMYNPSSVTVSVDKTSGQNGEKAYVTVKVASEGSLFGGEIVTITSTLGGVSHYLPVWVASK